MRKKPAGAEKKLKKKTSILTTEKVVWVDYKDANLLRRFMSDRAKIRVRRVTGNDQQQQAAVARAIKLSREMALLPYSVRQVQQRTKGRGRGDRRDAELRAEVEAAAPEGEGVEATLGAETGESAETSETGEVVETPGTPEAGDGAEAEVQSNGGEALADAATGGDAE